MPITYDAIVVGARCAGASTAMLLARRGHRVLLVDRARFPSDTLSTHLVHPVGVAALQRWGLLGALRAAGTPPISSYAADFGPFRISGAPRPAAGGTAEAYAPRRFLLDDLLVRAAATAGADVRTDVVVEDLTTDAGAVTGIRGRVAGGGVFRERARIVVGADGRRSLVAGRVGAAAYAQQPTHAATYFSYWAGVPVHGLEVYVRPRRSFGAFPTLGGLTVVVVSWPRTEFAANRHDVEGNILATLRLAPGLAERVAAGHRAERIAGTADVPGFYRTAAGRGWALAGDSRHHKDPCTARGITDAFTDAEALAEALDDVWCGRAGYGERMARYQRERDAATMPMYEFTTDMARLQPPPPELAGLLAAVSRSPRASRDFVSVLAGTRDLPEFFDPRNVARILAAGAA